MRSVVQASPKPADAISPVGSSVLLNLSTY